MKRFVGYLIDKGIKSLPRKKKVSPDIKSVKPTKDIKGSVERVKTEEFRKRYKAVDKAEDKMKTGKKMMREGQKERKKLIDTGRAVQFKHTKTVSAIKPGEKNRFKGLTTEEKPKKFKKGKELDREKKMGGGMMGRRFGYKKGSKKFPDLTGDGKVTFADILKGRGVINGKKKKA